MFPAPLRSVVFCFGFLFFFVKNVGAAPPGNDNCSGATALTIGTGSAGTVSAATASSGISIGCATGDPNDDVWYSFVAATANATVTLSSVSANLTTAGPRIQVFSGTCTNLTSIVCGTTTANATSLIYGTKYYIRVYSSGTTAVTTGTFTITITNTATSLPEYNIASGTTNEVFKQTTLSAANVLNDPWEVAYGPDGYLWITEAKGYKVYKMDPATGVKTTVLDISQGASGYLTTAQHTAFNVQFTQSSLSPTPATLPSTTSCGCWPQGGFAGLALHPLFLDATTPKNYVYVSYVRTFNSMTASNAGVFFTNSVVRFTYNTSTNRLESPVALSDTLPGSSDHNSQRMIIAPVSGTNYLFYASGDMGAGQFGNSTRANKAQITASYEGKILRFNLEADGDAGTYDKWIPNDNPFNSGTQSAVWSTGIRNNQGFAALNVSGTDYLYGSSHGPFSDDEINIIEKSKNYGHPLVIGYAADGNYNNSKAGNGSGNLLPLITSEAANASAIGTDYKDPIFSAYAPAAGNSTTAGTVNYIYTNNPSNGGWPSEGWSGMDVYTSTAIPGWKNSLIIGSLKWGRVLRLKLDDAGTAITTVNGVDTTIYFGSTNRYRDLALAPNGKDLFVIMDKSSATSGPSYANPVAPACPGCVQKYTFVGYQNNSSNKSTIPTTIPVTTGTANSCTTDPVVTIDASNNNIWVPIVGTDGNIMAEINANGNNLGAITSSFYTNTSTVRRDGTGRPFLNRNMTITPATQPATPVSVRLYITAAEFNALKATSGSGVTAITGLSIYKNSDACGSTVRSSTLAVTPLYAEAFGSDYVIGANISSFSSFYFANSGFSALPLQLVAFKGLLQGSDALLQWETATETNTARFEVERSTDGIGFQKIGTVAAAGTSSANASYAYTDKGAALLPTNTIYYRLRTVDKDGKVSYSQVAAIRLPRNGDVMVFPNPVKEKVTVRISNMAAKNVTVQVSDVQGRVVYSSKEQLHQNVSNISIDARHWTPQLYVIKIVNSKNEVLATQKFEKL